jgi:hypothetical protein
MSPTTPVSSSPRASESAAAKLNRNPNAIFLKRFVCRYRVLGLRV